MANLDKANNRSLTALKVCSCLSSAFGLALIAQMPAAIAQNTQNIFVIRVTDDPPIDAGDDGDLSIKQNLISQRVHASQVTGDVAPIVIAAPPSNALKSRIGHDEEDEPKRDLQINDPRLDHIQTFPGTRPFENATESETSIGVSGRHIVVGYNSSAGPRVADLGAGQLVFTQVLFSAYSVSHDGGRTWRSRFVPPVSPAAAFTAGDPSVAVDRAGNFWYAHLARDGAGQFGIGIAKSTDHGETFNPSMVFLDPGADKDWLAIGPDPIQRSRDNLYVTWTRFSSTGSELMLSKSLDGGATWRTDVIYAPFINGMLSNMIQFSNPVVDRSTGRLYIPFLQFSFFNADFIRVLVSDDGGFTFKGLAFNVPGAPDAFSYPVVQPGVVNNCGGGGLRLSLHQGDNAAQSGVPNYRFATRLVTQPAAVAFDGHFAFAFNSSTSPFFDRPDAGSEIDLLASNDGGQTWEAPVKVAASTADDPHHVHPAIALSEDGEKLMVAYYVQQADIRLRTDVTSLRRVAHRWEVKDTDRLSTSTFDLTPSNNTLSNGVHTNFDRTVVSCYNIGEYMAIASHGDRTVAAWGDNRHTWIGPAGSSAPGPHAKADVFFEPLDDKGFHGYDQRVAERNEEMPR
jgi:hypothetical protein